MSLLFSPVLPAADELIIDDFSSGNLDGWGVRSFVGETSYQLVEQQGRPVLKAQSLGTASALYKEIKVDLRQTPYLNWSWRIENIYSIKDQRVKAGDDFAARIYVVFKTGIFPWNTRALNYVWSNYAVDAAQWPNPFTDKAIMIPLRAGVSQTGQWHRERVNIREDYLRVFKEPIDSIDGIAIMTDGDNSGGAATAYYGTISFSQ